VEKIRDGPQLYFTWHQGGSKVAFFFFDTEMVSVPTGLEAWTGWRDGTKRAMGGQKKDAPWYGQVSEFRPFVWLNFPGMWL